MTASRGRGDDFSLPAGNSRRRRRLKKQYAVHKIGSASCLSISDIGRKFHGSWSTFRYAVAVRKCPSALRKRFVRCDSLGDDYTEAAIMERIFGKRIVAPRATAAAQSKPMSGQTNR